ncbi:hypothetical protein K4A58_004973, partial [Escherichia coli]|nr:hypothetical protein [Escherichia coli]
CGEGSQTGDGEYRREQRAGLVNAGGEPFAVVQVQQRFAPEAISHSLALAASLDEQGYSVNDIIHILMAEGGQA